MSFLLFAPCSEVLIMYLFVRSVLLAWTLSNGLLAAIITTTNDNGTANRAVNGYMAFLLFSVAGLACELLSYISYMDVEFSPFPQL